MAYDEALAVRIRQLTRDIPRLEERNMFGGLAFLVGGNMAVAVSGQGGLLVRCDPADSDSILSSSKAKLMVMRGRAMSGWLRVSTTDVQSDEKLSHWVALGTRYAASLPPKELT
jgi:TfoX/Sxy family transcriptional regulator of competence genes